MKRRLLNLLLVLIIAFAFAAPVFASSLVNPDLPRVVDYGYMFTDDEEAKLEEALYKLINKYGYDFLIMTAENHGSASDDYEYIEGVWDANNFGTGSDYSGWAIFICLQDRTWIHDSCGRANDYLTYDTVNIIDDKIESKMQSGDYYGAMMDAISELDTLFRLGAEKYVQNASGGGGGGSTQKTFWEKLMTGGISGTVAGFIAGLINVGRAKRSMKTVSAAYGAGEYVERGSFRMARNEDILMNTYTQRTPKTQHSSGGGGGGGSPVHSGQSSYHAPHVSSGGNVHSGGGGRKF